MQEYNTPLLLACNYASVNVIRALVKGGADIEARNTKVMGIAFLVDDIKSRNACRAICLYIFNYA